MDYLQLVARKYISLIEFCERHMRILGFKYWCSFVKSFHIFILLAFLWCCHNIIFWITNWHQNRRIPCCTPEPSSSTWRLPPCQDWWSPTGPLLSWQICPAWTSWHIIWSRSWWWPSCRRRGSQGKGEVQWYFVGDLNQYEVPWFWHCLVSGYWVCFDSIGDSQCWWFLQYRTQSIGCWLGEVLWGQGYCHVGNRWSCCDSALRFPSISDQKYQLKWDLSSRDWGRPATEEAVPFICWWCCWNQAQVFEDFCTT